MAKPALTIDVDAKTTKYDRAMKAIGDVADKKVSEIESKFESFDPQLNADGYTKSITGMAASFGVAGLAIAAAVGLVINLNKSLAETASLADRVGISTERLQQLKFGANSLGVGDNAFNSSLDSFASKLQDAKFKGNDLTRVFVANGVAIRDNNGKLKDTGTLLDHAIDIIKRAPSIQDAIQIGGFLGFSKEFSQNINEAGDNFLKLASQANAAGAVIDEATIEKAKEFDREWTKAAALWGTNLKAAIGEVLPLLNDAVNVAVTVVKAVSNLYDFAKSTVGFFKEFALPTDFNSESLNTINGQLKTFLALRDKVNAGVPLNPIESLQANTYRASNDQSQIEVIDQVIAKLKDAKKTAEEAGGAVKRVVINGGASVNPGPSSSSAAGPRDQFDRTVDQITKRTATINADTAATFQNNAVQAQFRAEFQLLTAIMRDNGEVTQQQIDLYETYRQTMSAQQALEAAGIQLTSDHKDKFIAAADGIMTATLAYNQARESLNRLNSASSQLGSALSGAFSDAIVEGKSFGDVLTSLAKQLEKMAINSVFSSLFNAPSAGGVSPFLSMFGMGHNATGTDNWRGGPTWVGENGPEIIDAPAGSQIIPNSALRGASRSNINVTLVEDSSRAGQVSKRQSDSGIDLVAYVDSITAKNAGNPGSATSRVLNQRGRLARR